ncbi:MAG: hypothetical protein JWL69_1045 [Phycisphaerales bacterium]|nr:hypothetical protein [Phycisphaerales bacterium]
MSNSSQEIIEARLAAYVDNDLDAQERAEIERHLEEHPQHRVLLEELRKGREMLRSLPRESAPPELAEAFNGQLERSVLLDGVGDYEEPRMRVGRWPQMFAAAAIVFLTLGLAGVVYFALPNHKAFQVADTRSAPKAQPTDNSLATGGRSEGGPADDGNPERSKLADHDEKMLGKSGTSDGVTDSFGKGGVNAKNSSNGVSEPHDNLTVLAENVSQVPQVQELLADNYRAQNAIASTSNEAVVLAVRSNNPKETERDLAGYLEPNRITLERVPDQVPATVNSSLALRNNFNYAANGEAPAPEQNSGAPGNSPEASQQQQTLMKKDESGPLNNAQRKVGDVAQSSARGTGGGGAAKPTTDDATEQKLPANSAGAKRMDDESLAARNRGGQTLDSAAAPAPDNATRAQQSQQPAATDSQIAQRQQQQLPSPAQQPAAQAALNQNAEQGVAEANFNTIDNLYVVRGLSRRQAQELTDRLSRNGEVRKAELSRRGGDGHGYALNNSSLADNQANDATNSSRAFQGGVDKAAAGVNAAGGQNDRMREAVAKSEQERNLLPRASKGLREQRQGQTTADSENSVKEAEGVLPGPALKPAAAMGPATRPADEIVRKGDSLNLYYRQPQRGAAEESEVVRVGDDGTIAPRRLDGAKDTTVVAAGKTLSELEKSLQTFGVGPATAPAVRNAMARRDVRVERITQAAAAAPPPPAAQAGGLAAPAAGKDMSDAPPASTPAGQRAFAAAVNPSTLAAGSATRPAEHEPAASQPAIAGAADEPVDVVIVVQKDASPAGNAVNPAAPGPAPSAAPAGNNPATPATQPAAPAPHPDKP